MSELEFLCKLRDAFRMAHEAIDEYIGLRVPRKPTKQSTWDPPGKRSWNPDNVKWESAEGTKGPYEKSSSQVTEDAKRMLQDLKDHNGTMTRDGFFYWIFQGDEATVGRKRRGS